MVGDPTGQSDARPRLTREDVQAAAKTYTEQAFKVLDPERVELRSNAEWLDAMRATDFVELMAKMTVSRMLERNDFALRYQEHRPIFQHEFLYPLLQGYDSVALDCDVELGGTDQLFNLLVGRDLMPKYGLRAQAVLTTPILEGTDARMESGRVVGKKMSKSAGNYVGLSEAPNDMYRKLMQVDDHVIFRYFELLSQKSSSEIDALRAAMADGKNPMEIKDGFAREMVTRFHSVEAAGAAADEFRRVYAGDAVPDDVPEHALATEGDGLWLPKALSAAGLVRSTGDGKRLVEQGGVEVDQTRVTDSSLKLSAGARYLLRVGSKNRKFAYIRVVTD
jgi:tyrosyl-tRNA synthetase